MHADDTDATTNDTFAAVVQESARHDDRNNANDHENDKLRPEVDCGVERANTAIEQHPAAHAVHTVREEHLGEEYRQVQDRDDEFDQFECDDDYEYVECKQFGEA